ncbi:MAG: hypothetical protein GY862_31830 [Gammaproteobacteria bacterium]|nr:hypothetical protein [Gammaproteobacteria bacterium]
MTLAQTIHQHALKFPEEKQAEILDFVLVLEKKLNSAAVSSPESQLASLFAALDKSRNQKSVGRLRREELYDRAIFHRY